MNKIKRIKCIKMNIYKHLKKTKIVNHNPNIMMILVNKVGIIKLYIVNIIY